MFGAGSVSLDNVPGSKCHESCHSKQVVPIILTGDHPEKVVTMVSLGIQGLTKSSFLKSLVCRGIKKN